MLDDLLALDRDTRGYPDASPPKAVDPKARAREALAELVTSASR